MDFLYVPWIGRPQNNQKCITNEFTPSYNIPSAIIYAPLGSGLDVSPAYKFTFFNARGSAETTRLMLIYLQIPFIDERVSFDDFVTKKNDLIFRQMPLLELPDRTIICHSESIASFIAKEHGLVGTSNLEQAKADEIVHNVNELINSIKGYVVLKVKYDGIKKVKNPVKFRLHTTSAQKGLDRFLPQLELACSGALRNEHGYIFSSGITYADFYVATAYSSICGFFSCQPNQFKALQHVMQKIHSLPELQIYLNTRPETLF